MNIFILDSDPVVAAQHQCDKHVVKMILESAQLLCSPFQSGAAPYKRAHFNHPCAKWTRQSQSNYEWLVQHGLALCDEYTRRYHKTHASQSVIEWCKNNYHSLDFPCDELTPHPLCMPDECKIGTPVESYRHYYKTHKRRIAVWKYSPTPWWWKKQQTKL